MDFHSCWIYVVTELQDVGVGVAEGPAPAKSLVLSPGGAVSSARSLLSVRRDEAGGKGSARGEGDLNPTVPSTAGMNPIRSAS